MFSYITLTLNMNDDQGLNKACSKSISIEKRLGSVKDNATLSEEVPIFSQNAIYSPKQFHFFDIFLIIAEIQSFI